MSHRHSAGTADRSEIRASTATGYRMPPLHPHLALEDCLAVYRRALAAELAAQHLVLVAQHEQLRVRGQLRPGQYRQQAEQAPHQPVEQR